MELGRGELRGNFGRLLLLRKRVCPEFQAQFITLCKFILNDSPVNEFSEKSSTVPIGGICIRKGD